MCEMRRERQEEGLANIRFSRQMEENTQQRGTEIEGHRARSSEERRVSENSSGRSSKNTDVAVIATNCHKKDEIK